jgi:hypothetical protein
MSEQTPLPRLRQGPPPPEGSGRKVLIGVFAFFVLLVAFVITLVVTIGQHNHGVKIPPGPRPTSTVSLNSNN